MSQYTRLESEIPLDDIPSATTTLAVTGMTCSACLDSVTLCLSSVSGVHSVAVSLITNEAVIKHDLSVDPAVLRDAVDDIGFEAEVQNTVKSQKNAPSDSKTASALSVHGMTCSACVGAVTAALENVPGVLTAKVSLLTEEAIITHTADVNPQSLVDAVDDAGFEAEIAVSPSQALTVDVQLRFYGIPREPLTSKSLEDVLKSSEVIKSGIISASVDSQNCTARVSYDATQAGIRAIVECIRQHFDVDVLILNGAADSNTSQLNLLSKYKEILFWRSSFIKSLICGVPVFIMSHFLRKRDVRLLPGLYLHGLISFVLTAYVQCSVGKSFYHLAYQSLKHGSATMDVLIVTLTTVSFVFSVFAIFVAFLKASSTPPMLLFDTAAMLFVFISLGKWIECRAKGQTTSSLSELMKLLPYTCSLVKESKEFLALCQDDSFDPSDFQCESILLDLIQINDVIFISPGAKVPCDGVVVHGVSEMNESLLTGESLPVPKAIGDSVIAGLLNILNSVYVRVTTVGAQTVLSSIIGLVRSAQFEKAPIQRFSDRIALKFVPGIVILSVVTFFVWYMCICLGLVSPSIFHNSNGTFFNCLRIAILVVVIACPCALGLAAPTAIMAGTGVGAKNGILLKGGDIFETLTKVDTVLFDKTNTLTTGNMTVFSHHFNQEAMASLGLSEYDLWAILFKLEHGNGHPISIALCRHVESKGVTGNTSIQVDSVENCILKGVKGMATINGERHSFMIGNRCILENLAEKADEDSNSKTTIHIATSTTYIGSITLSDQLKKGAKEVIQWLSNHSIEACMVTGDSFGASRSIASSLGIASADVFAETLPDQKQAIVSRLKDAGRTVLFVGDGINDSPAISAADVGVSFSEATEIAASAADVILLDSNILTPLIMALDLSKKTFRTIKMNFLLASIYNLLMVPLAMLGIVHPFLAAAAMSLSSVCVVSNSLRLNGWRPKEETKRSALGSADEAV